MVGIESRRRVLYYRYRSRIIFPFILCILMMMATRVMFPILIKVIRQLLNAAAVVVLVVMMIILSITTTTGTTTITTIPYYVHGFQLTSSSLSALGHSSSLSLLHRHYEYSDHHHHHHHHPLQQRQNRSFLRSPFLTTSLQSSRNSSNDNNDKSIDNPTVISTTTITTTTILVNESSKTDDATDTTTTTNSEKQSDTESTTLPPSPQQQQQQRYLQGLYENLQTVLDQYMISGNQQQQQQRAYNILQQIQQQQQQYESNENNNNNNDHNESTTDPTASSSSSSSSYYQRALRLIQRTGLPLPTTSSFDAVETSPPSSSSSSSPTSSIVSQPQKQDQSEVKKSSKGVVFGWSTSNTDQRRNDVNARKDWEVQQQQQQQQQQKGNYQPSNNNNIRNNNEPLQREKQFINDKTLLEKELYANKQNLNDQIPGGSFTAGTSSPPQKGMEDEATIAAMNRVSAFMARASRMDSKNHSQFDGSTFGIGGLDDILQQIHRRIYIPLISPPTLLAQLGMTPVRGLLLYGPPGCGKTLMAREIGQYISPLRPITVISGPEIMDKFVGSSEMKLRNIFDNPPNIYEAIRQQEPDQGVALSKVALHVIIMDEFDAIARQRGGRDSKNGSGNDQGDAGVARDSVVNQLLAKMDGVVPLVVPTLVIGVTNKRSLIDTALLRPGRFEIQIEVPPPKTVEQRISILQIHTRHMYTSGRLLVQDAPTGTAAADMVANFDKTDRWALPTYSEVLETIANSTENFTGASLAAVVRAAASFALERSVSEYISNVELNSSLLQECVVTIDDFRGAINDFENMDGSDSSLEQSLNEAVSENDSTSDAESSAGFSNC